MECTSRFWVERPNDFRRPAGTRSTSCPLEHDESTRADRNLRASASRFNLGFLEQGEVIGCPTPALASTSAEVDAFRKSHIQLGQQVVERIRDDVEI